MSDNNNQTINEKFQLLLESYKDLNDLPISKSDLSYQKKLYNLINQFKFIKRIIYQLDLFSDNESIVEFNVNYLPFLNIDYYLGELYLNYLSDGEPMENPSIDLKAINLSLSKEHFDQFLHLMINYKLLSKTQLKQFNDKYTLTREEKIENYRAEKDLTTKVSLINQQQSVDEDTKKDIYINQINLFIIKTLNQLQLLDMELQVLSNRPKNSTPQPPANSVKPFEYTEKLETIPSNKVESFLKNGKVLKPFTITRDDIKSKVFGTGQVLPSMTVEEYLDYELKNGKMLQPEESKLSDDEDLETEELKNRAWDDWKDDNPKGSGNTKANLG